MATCRQLTVVLALLILTAAAVEGKCIMTQKCVNPDNLPDYDECIPEAHKELQDPQPVSCQI